MSFILSDFCLFVCFYRTKDYPLFYFIQKNEKKTKQNKKTMLKTKEN